MTRSLHPGTIYAWAMAGVLGSLIGSTLAVLLTELIKVSLADAVGISLAVLILLGLGKGQPVQTIAPLEDRKAKAGESKTSWYSFPHDIAWALAPLRALAILATVGLGAPMGTESPAADSRQ